MKCCLCLYPDFHVVCHSTLSCPLVLSVCLPVLLDAADAFHPARIMNMVLIGDQVVDHVQIGVPLGGGATFLRSPSKAGNTEGKHIRQGLHMLSSQDSLPATCHLS